MKKFLLLTSTCVFLSIPAVAEDAHHAAPAEKAVEHVKEKVAEVVDTQKEDITEKAAEAMKAKVETVKEDAGHKASEEVKAKVEAVVEEKAPEDMLKTPEDVKPLIAKSSALKVPVPEVEKHQGPAHWGYVGDDAADKWGDLDAQYHACKAGLKQSPIDIQEFKRDDALPSPVFAYNAAPLKVVNNGHTLQVNYPEGSKAMVGTETFNFLQLHFHTPSEHYIDGTPFPMEAHFVHKNAAGELGVFGVLIKVGEENSTIESIWSNAPATKGENLTDVSINAAALFPADKTYYKYSGSLTTPPCSEGVHWHVLKDPIEISEKQLVRFQTLFPMNARPIQPLHDRVVKGK